MSLRLFLAPLAALLMTLAAAGAALAHGEACGCGKDHPCSCEQE